MSIKTIIEEFKNVGLDIEIKDNYIHIESQDGNKLLKVLGYDYDPPILFNISTGHTYDLIRTNLIISDTLESVVPGSAIITINKWFNKKNVLLNVLLNTDEKIKSDLNEISAKFRPTFILNEIIIKMASPENQISFGPVINNKSRTLIYKFYGQNFVFIYTYFGNFEQLELLFNDTSIFNEKFNFQEREEVDQLIDRIVSITRGIILKLKHAKVIKNYKQISQKIKKQKNQ